MLQNIRAALHLIVTAALAACSLAQDDEKPIRINDTISMVLATSNVYLVTTSAGDVLIDTAIAEIAGELPSPFRSPPAHRAQCASEN